MQQMLNPANWYWFVGGDTTKVYSSARNIYVNPTTDAAYLAFVGTTANIPSEAALWYYLQGILPAWLFNGTTFSQPAVGQYTQAQLAAYASLKQTNILGGGISVNIGTTSAPVNVEAGTSVPSLVLLNGAQSMATANSSASFTWVQANGTPVTLTSAQVLTIFTAVTTFIQATFTTLGQVLSAIGAKTITTQAQVDTPPSPIPAWPINS